MKNNIFFSVVLGLVLAGCQPATVEVKKESLNNKNNQWEIDVQKSVFSSSDAGVEKGCTAVNRVVEALIDSLQLDIKAQADTFFTTYGKMYDEKGPEWAYQLYVKDSVFMATDKYISLRVLVYTFMGGAHGMTNFYAFNYDVQKQHFLTDQEIINYDKANEINGLLVKYFNNPEGCFSDKPTLTNGFTALNVSPVAVCFTYPQYTLGAYACGVAQVTIPDDVLKGILKIKE